MGGSTGAWRTGPDPRPATNGAPPETIVVGIDGTSCGDAALAWAIAEARLRRGVLHVVIAKSQQLSSTEHVSRDGITSGVCSALLREALDRVGGAAGVRLTMVPRADHPFLELSLEARARRASLIVIGNHPHGKIRDAFGDIPSALLRHHTHCPVVAVPAGEATPRSGRIVVGGSASDAGEAARRWAVAEGPIRDASVTVVQAVGRAVGADVTSARRHPARSAPSAPGRRAELEGPGTEAVPGPMVDVLLAASEGAELLVLGAPRHLRLTEVAGHAGSRSLLRASTIPIVLVPADAGECRSAGIPLSVVPPADGPRSRS
jgi:nucleotide-binding universal stress UspA family protein